MFPHLFICFLGLGAEIIGNKTDVFLCRLVAISHHLLQRGKTSNGNQYLFAYCWHELSFFISEIFFLIIFFCMYETYFR